MQPTALLPLLLLLSPHPNCLGHDRPPPPSPNAPSEMTNASCTFRGWPQPLGGDLIPLFRHLYSLVDQGADPAHARSKRTVRIFPEGSEFLTKWNINIPVHATMYKSGYNFDLYAFLPFPAFLMSLERRKKRSLTSSPLGDLGGEPDLRKDDLHRKMKAEEKLRIYSQLEAVLERFGLPARDCLLRLICDVSETPLLHGLFGEIFNSLFRMSNHPNDLKEETQKDDLGAEYFSFLEAERHGTTQGQCHSKYPLCDATHLLPIIENTILSNL